MPRQRKIENVIKDISIDIGSKLDNYSNIGSASREVFAAELMAAVAHQIETKFGYVAAKWGADAAAERLRVAHDKERRPDWREHT